ncbi:MAG: DUF2760 domain-containing protein [Deltaproteobacteria bacterium]|nr:DUF2760 domain-containing protein [Deltaproteobacteria bacterium]MBI3388316.1 DUF2760 domain-containing protein [Deltaproteobacteria bacterium]
MAEQSRGGFAAVLIIMIVALASAAGNVEIFVHGGAGIVSFDEVTHALHQCAPCVIFLAGVPVVAGLVLAAWSMRRARRVVDPAPLIEGARPGSPSPDAALRMLALLQHEGRLIDFLEEDIAAYDDAQVGAAVRSIHEGCRKVLRERVQLQRVIEQDDGAIVDVPAGFDPATIRVTGNVTGAPPFRGTLQHGGWRAVKITLPESATDAAIVAPAEVEIS